MARLARVVVPGVPHHVTQRGNRRQPVFFRDDDYRDYLALLVEHSPRRMASSVLSSRPAARKADHSRTGTPSAPISVTPSSRRVRCARALDFQARGRETSRARTGFSSISRTGRPLGSVDFVKRLEARTGRQLARRKPGRKPDMPARRAVARPA